MNVIRRWITQPNALLRAAALFGAGMALTLAAACLSWLAPRGAPEKRQSPVELGGLLPPPCGRAPDLRVQPDLCLRPRGGQPLRQGTAGGSPDPLRLLLSPPAVPALWLMVGTWSFQMGGEAPPFAARLLRMLHISEASGMVEMSAFCCIASGTADISFVQTLGGRTTAGRLRDIRLSRQDGLVLALGFLLLFAAAMIEAASILRLT